MLISIWDNIDNADCQAKVYEVTGRFQVWIKKNRYGKYTVKEIFDTAIEAHQYLRSNGYWHMQMTINPEAV